MNYQKGGQRRTIETGCGWKCVGHPTEVNKKYLRHRRYCNTCNENNTTELPEFNKEGGKINGWKGLTNRHQQPNQMLTTAFVEGVRKDIFLDGVKSMEDALNDTRLVAALAGEGGGEIHLTKSQKKRMRQKAKKEAEKEV
jgi:hypothetical protein